jgi:hypothetical protein
MSWHFSRALVEEYSQDISLGGAQSALLSVNPTPLAYLCNDRMTAFSTRSLSGMTFAPLTADLGAVLLTWFLEGFPVKISQLPAEARVLKVNAVAFGESSSGSLARYSHGSSSWRTHQCSLFGGGYELLQTLPKWGIAHNGELWAQVPSIRYVKASDFGLSLLRPTAQCWKAWTFLKISSLVRKNHADGNIQEQSARCFHKMITAESNEILMKWPAKWTDLKPLETDKFRDWRSSHGKS